jgi:hypothetical protein
MSHVLSRNDGLPAELTRQPASRVRETHLPQDLGHRRLSGPPPGMPGSPRRNHVRRGWPRPAGGSPAFRGISGPETAFVVRHDRPNARAAQRRPGAEHRARPVLPVSRPSATERISCTPGLRPPQGGAGFLSISGIGRPSQWRSGLDARRIPGMENSERAARSGSRQPALGIGEELSTTRPGTSKALWTAPRWVIAIDAEPRPAGLAQARIARDHPPWDQRA